MKRDMELIRQSLFEVEGEKPVLELSAYTEDQKVYHMALCIEAGLVDGDIVKDSNGYPGPQARVGPGQTIASTHGCFVSVRHNALVIKPCAACRELRRSKFPRRATHQISTWSRHSENLSRESAVGVAVHKFNDHFGHG